MAERSDLPGDLRLLGRAAAPGRAQPGPGPLLGLYASQPAPAELLLELLDHPPAGPGSGRKELPEREKTEYLLSQAPAWRSPPSAGVLCFVVFLEWLLGAGPPSPSVCVGAITPPLHLC